MVDEMRRHAQGGLEYSGKCFLSHSACIEDAKAVARLVESTFKHLDGDVMINNIGTVIGAHTGPGTVALFFWGDRRAD
jgi:fatty acid-binding protein DegV